MGFLIEIFKRKNVQFEKRKSFLGAYIVTGSYRIAIVNDFDMVRVDVETPYDHINRKSIGSDDFNTSRFG